jgi:hypothetical protein
VTASLARARALSARLLGLLDARPLLLWLAVFLPLVTLYLATMRTNVMDMSADPVAVTPSAWGLAHLGSPVVPASHWPTWNPWAVHVGGDLVVSNRAPGLVLLATPFYWLFGSASPFDPFPASLAAALITAAAMATLALVFRRLCGTPVAFAAAYVAGVATTTWAVSGTSLWPHGPDELLLALAMVGCVSGSLLGTAMAFMVIAVIRPPHEIIVATLTADGLLRRRPWLRLAVFSTVSGLGLLLYLAYAEVFWHGGLDSGYADVGSSFTGKFFDVSPGALGHYVVNVLGALVAPGKGVLPNSPFLLALLPGLRAGWRAAPRWSRSFAVGGVLYLLVILKANRFSGGDEFWGYRYPIGTLTAIAPLLVFAWVHWTSRTAVRRRAFVALLAVSVALQTIGATIFRGPYAESPWSLHDLTAALTGPQAAQAQAIWVTGLAVAALSLSPIALACVRRRWRAPVEHTPGTTRSARAGVLHVARPDHVLVPVDVNA